MRGYLSRYKVFLLIVSTVLLVIMLTGCGTQSENGQTGEQQPEGTDDQTEEQNSQGSDEEKSETVEYPTVEENPIVTITMENEEQIIVELYPEIAPNTVANFISLIKKDFYNGVIFHRVIPGFMIQGGDPDGNGSGGPGYSIEGEFTSNGFENNLKHDRGILSMARTRDPNSAGSQFFIMVADSPQLDEEYASFGKVVEGMETVDEIVSIERDAVDKPLEDQLMKTVVVDTKGYDYPEPVVQ